MSCLCAPPHATSCVFGSTLSFDILQRGYRGTEPRCIHGPAPLKPGEPTVAEERLTDGGRRTHLFPSSTVQIRLYGFFCSFSYTLQSSFLSHTDCAGSWKLVALEMYSPVGPSMCPAFQGGHTALGRLKPPKAKSLSVLHCRPQHRNTSPGRTVHVALDECPKGTCCDSKLTPVPSGHHL